MRYALLWLCVERSLPHKRVSWPLQRPSRSHRSKIRCVWLPPTPTRLSTAIRTTIRIVSRTSNPLCLNREIALLSVQLLVAVLMAVRYQLFCFWLRPIAAHLRFLCIWKKALAAFLCVRMQHHAKRLKTDSKSADPCHRGGSTPLPAHCRYVECENCRCESAKPLRRRSQGEVAGNLRWDNDGARSVHGGSLRYAKHSCSSSSIQIRAARRQVLRPAGSVVFCDGRGRSSFQFQEIARTVPGTEHAASTSNVR